MKVPYGPAAVYAEQSSINHWETGKREQLCLMHESEDLPFCLEYPVTSDDRCREVFLLCKDLPIGHLSDVWEPSDVRCLFYWKENENE